MFTKKGDNVRFVILLIVVFAIFLSLCACGETEETPKATATVQVSVEPTGQKTTVPTESSTESPSELTTSVPTAVITEVPTESVTATATAPVTATSTATTTATATATTTTTAIATAEQTSDSTVNSTLEPTSSVTVMPTSGPLTTSTAKPTETVQKTPQPTSGVPDDLVEIPTITTKYVVRRDFTDHVSEVYASDDLEEAKLFADMNAHTGYSVFDASGNVIYSKYSQKVTDLLKACRKISDKLIVDGFKLGVAPKNPAFDDSAKLIAADTFVGWVLYESGYRGGQPEDTGLVFNEPGSHGNLVDFCIANGLTKITNIDDVKTGDIVFYSKTEEGATYPDSVCIVASDLFEDDSQYLYDLSNVEDLSEMQPMRQPLISFMFAYRIK